MRLPHGASIKLKQVVFVLRDSRDLKNNYFRQAELKQCWVATRGGGAARLCDWEVCFV